MHRKRACCRRGEAGRIRGTCPVTRVGLVERIAVGIPSHAVVRCPVPDQLGRRGRNVTHTLYSSHLLCLLTIVS